MNDYIQYGLIIVCLIWIVTKNNTIHLKTSNNSLVKELKQLRRLIHITSNKPKRVYIVDDEPKEEIKKTYALNYTYDQKPQQCKVSQFNGNIDDIDAFNHMSEQLIDIHEDIDINDFRKL